jgi:hypothetical protein
LDIKGAVETPPNNNYNTTPIPMGNTRTQDVVLLSCRRPEPV